MSYPCPVDDCKHGKGETRYVGNTEAARAAHVQKRHPDYLRPLPVPPTYTPVLAPKRAAVYLRVSTIDQHPENQLPQVRTYCAAKGYDVVAIYEDKASGKNMDRPELRRMLADSVATAPPPFDIVVFTRLSRLGRSLRDNIALFDHFQALGVALAAVHESYDTTSPSGRLIRNVLASVYEYERENMIEQVREGLARRRAEGKYMGRHPAGCGIPTELGGLGPCPDGVTHKGLSRALNTVEAKRAAARLRKQQQREREKERRARAKGTADPVTGKLPPEVHGPSRRDMGAESGA